MKPTVLSTVLPEDIQRVKEAGDFSLALKMIDYRLACDIPEGLKNRLLFEKDVIERIREDFVYSKDEVLEILKEKIVDFTEEEFEELFLSGAFEFYYINGQMLFNKRFLLNLTKTRKQYALRQKDVVFERCPYLDEAIAEVKKEGVVKTRYTMRTTLTVNEGSLKKDKKLRVWLPIPCEDAQISEVQVLKTSEGIKQIGPSDALARTVYFETKNVEQFSVEYSFVNTNRFVNPKSSEVKEYTCDLSEYLKEEKPHIVFTDYLKELTSTVVGQETNPLLKAKKIYEYITSKIMYSFMRPYLTLPIITEYISTSLKGDCGVQALLFITMCRIAGVPAKWQSGLFIDEDEVGAHDWTMFYVEPYGWLFADPSFGGSAYRFGYDERREFYFGHLDKFRIVQATTFQADINPDTNFTRKDPYDNQLGEIEYEDEPFGSEDYDVIVETLKIEKL